MCIGQLLGFELGVKGWGIVVSLCSFLKARQVDRLASKSVIRFFFLKYICQHSIHSFNSFVNSLVGWYVDVRTRRRRGQRAAIATITTTVEC